MTSRTDQDDQAWRRDRVGSALRGDNPTVLRRLRAGFAVIGDAQHFPGYCVLISDDPTASSLTDLPRERQEIFLADAALLARAVERVARRPSGEAARQKYSTKTA